MNWTDLDPFKSDWTMLCTYLVPIEFYKTNGTTCLQLESHPWEGESRKELYTYYHVWSMWLQRNVFCLSCQESARGCGLQEFHRVCLCTVGKNVGNCEEIKHQNVVNFQCATNIIHPPGRWLVNWENWKENSTKVEHT